MGLRENLSLTCVLIVVTHHFIIIIIVPSSFLPQHAFPPLWIRVSHYTLHPRWLTGSDYYLLIFILLLCPNPHLPHTSLSILHPVLLPPCPHTSVHTPPCPHTSLFTHHPVLIPPCPHTTLSSYLPILIPLCPHTSLSSYFPPCCCCHHQGDCETINLLCDSGACVDVEAKGGLTALLAAVREDRREASHRVPHTLPRHSSPAYK